MNIVPALVIVATMIFLLSCLKAASDADDYTEFLKHREGLKDDDHVD